MLRILVYIIAIILLVELFNLQIVKGNLYRETSNSRLTREAVIKASRGYIYDRDGNILAGVKMAYCLQLYRSQISIEQLNTGILSMINILEKNKDTYVNDFPIQANPVKDNFNNETDFKTWKNKMGIDENLSAEAVLDLYKKKYNITNDNVNDVLKIIAIRYAIENTGYSSTNPLTISNDISKNSVLELSEKGVGLPGININIEPIREYEDGNLASHVLGYMGKVTQTDIDNSDGVYGNDSWIGKSGMESLLEEYLRGQDGLKEIDMNVDGGVTEEFTDKEAVAGSNITLTIDSKLQKATEDALKANIQKISAGGFRTKSNVKAGSAIVIDVKTGEILALANYPDFDPQKFIDGISTSDWNQYQTAGALFDRAVQGAYAPGSIYKMITALTALQKGVITPTQTILTKGVYPYSYHPECWLYEETGHDHGSINIVQGIKYSCDYFFYELGRRLGGMDDVAQYAKYFGLGSKTGIELPGEVSGMIATKANLEATGQTWNLGNTLSAAIGQGQNDYTPIQIAKYISMLANGGNEINPTLIKSVVNPDGTTVDTQTIENFVDNKLGFTPTEPQKVDISKANLQTVLKGMKGVTEDNDGTAAGAFINFPIQVAGKTGSAEAGNYINAWFAGFAPYDNPEIAVVIMEENGQKGSYAAEAARQIMSAYFNIKKTKVNMTTPINEE